MHQVLKWMGSSLSFFFKWEQLYMYIIRANMYAYTRTHTQRYVHENVCNSHAQTRDNKFAFQPQLRVIVIKYFLIYDSISRMLSDEWIWQTESEENQTRKRAQAKMSMWECIYIYNCMYSSMCVFFCRCWYLDHHLPTSVGFLTISN